MNKALQRGVSLTELLVSLVIASFLALVAVQITVDNKLAFLFQRAQADNQSNARFALQWLDQQLARTGYKRRPEQSLQAAFPAISEASSGVAGCSFAAGQVIKPLTGRALCIRYQPSDRQQFDCLGNSRATNDASLARPYAQPAEAYVEKLAVNSNQQLVCSSKDGSATLIEGIANARFDYGVASYGAHEATHYSATPASNDYIRSIRFALLLSSAAPASTTASDSPAWRYWHAMPLPAHARSSLYQVVKGTTALRNLLP